MEPPSLTSQVGGEVGATRHQGTNAPHLERRRAIRNAVAVFVLAFATYNANGREIASYDSQPTKLAAVELARYHRLTLDRPVALMPALKTRPGFTLDRQNHYRSAYPAFPSVIAAVVASAMRFAGFVDLRAPLAASLVAKVSASLLVALAVALAYAAARRRVGQSAAVLVAVGFGLGTSLWPLASQTLWQTETAAAALGGVVVCLALPGEELTTGRLWLAALLLGCAGAARPQLAPAIGIVALSIAVRRRRPVDALALLPLAAAFVTVVTLNISWFGTPLGAVPRLELLHPGVHRIASSFGNPLAGGAGLLFSPNRGLLVFSPVVLVALAALPALLRAGWRDDLRWWGAAAVLQVAFYACYSVWWRGHTYGPRYCVDVLPLLVPLAAAGLPYLSARRGRRIAGVVALAWSITVAATGAFVYPHEQWNSDPEDVDQYHDRLWDWRDAQILRCWKAGPSPQNFTLFSWAAIRRPPVAPKR